MMRLSVKVRTIGLGCVGWGHPIAVGPDIPFNKRAVSDKGNLSYELYIPGSTLKGVLRSSASRVSKFYGFTSCGEVRPEKIDEAHRSNGVCDVCRLFGYPKSGEQSPLIVSDLVSKKRPETIELTRTRIDDSSLKVAEGALFTIEYVYPKTIFEGTISFLDVESRLLGLLLLSMAELRLGRFGRGSMIDLMIEDAEGLRDKLDGTAWLPIFEDLGRWLWE
jgi:CRISPR/Cas system CSM-associated protein Csm3 (group 7 of RAMP superfamily)